MVLNLFKDVKMEKDTYATVIRIYICIHCGAQNEIILQLQCSLHTVV